MDVLLLCGYFESKYQTEITQKTKTWVENAANTFQQRLIKGFKKQDINLTVVSAPFIGPWPTAYQDILFKQFEEGESDEEAALREILEETGLKVTLLPDFKTFDEHGLPNKPDVVKRCINFAAEYDSQEIVRQDEELCEAALMSYDEAMSVFQFESSRRILKEVNDFLTK